MTTRTLEIGSSKNSDASTSKPFGLDLQWIAEGGSFSESKAKTRKILLVAGKAGVYVPFSAELSEDSGQSFQGQLFSTCTSALSWGVDDAILSGDGSGKPLGVLASSSLITVTKETGQLFATPPDECC
ncbi:MAG: phage major capsid protein [Candidatus Binatia bacterium]